VTSPITLAAIEKAALNIASHAVKTPLLEPRVLADDVGGRVFLKAETLQRTGTFKFRGAFNTIMNLSPEQRKRGVIAWSSGNHAQGVAAAAQIVGIPATIVMPADAPEIKRKNTESYGAKVIPYDRYSEDRRAIAMALMEETGCALIPPYDHPDVIAGQGTTGLEIAQQLKSQNLEPDQVLICCGGGGLTAGVSTAIKSIFPNCKTLAVEPEGYDDTKKSLETGKIQRANTSHKSLCDALLSPQPGELTFSINRHTVDQGLAVSEEEVLAAMRYGFEKLKLVIEPGGAVCLAAALAGKIDCQDKTTVLILSGGNVDPAIFAETIAG
jgi:threonine dehydratase